MHLLFLTRLLVYALAVAMPLVHPAVTVPYDRAGYLVWFALVPLEMLLAYSLRHAATGTTPILRRGRLARLAARARNWLRPPHLLAAACLAVVAAIAFGTGFDSAAWLVAGAGAGAFLLTLLIFGSREYGHTIAAAELFFIGFIYVKMLRFSRASEAISGASSLLTTVILLVAVGGFLLHGIVIYQAAFPNRRPGTGRAEDRRRGRREVTLFAAVIIPLIIVLAVILPPDFVEHQIAFNELNELPPSPPVPVDDFSTAPPGGNLRGEQQFEQSENGGGGGQGDQQQDQQDGEDGEGEAGQMPGLVGIPAREWEQRRQPQQPQPQPQPSQGQGQGETDGSGGGNTGEQGQSGGGSGQPNDANQGETGEEGDGNQDSGDGEGENQQHAVMIIASQQDPVYAADGYFGLFDGVRGFSYSRDEPLNELVYRRLFETWEDPEPPRELGRSLIEHGFFSTIPERVMAYRPLAVEPTVQQRRYHPFDLSYRVVSQVSTAGPPGWSQARPLSDRERDRMGEFLEVPLDTEQRARFQAYLDGVMSDAGTDFDRIDQLLRSYADYQYEIGFTDDVSISHVDNFLFETKAGDCTEFSNTSAILGRMLGIPTRVVTGYLGSESLQTPQHVRGAAILRQSIEPLQEHPVEDLYLITTAHRHSWTQFWLPDFGWIDFETTTHAKTPPPGAGRQLPRHRDPDHRGGRGAGAARLRVPVALRPDRAGHPGRGRHRRRLRPALRARRLAHPARPAHRRRRPARPRQAAVHAHGQRRLRAQAARPHRAGVCPAVSPDRPLRRPLHHAPLPLRVRPRRTQPHLAGTPHPVRDRAQGSASGRPPPPPPPHPQPPRPLLLSLVDATGKLG